ncbi:uncharacterized protein LOC141644267 isoform X2 [Silene latifolia]|uniref:uncharacterized protein LOC141644267 isoform X2 n=1 Tax=Silene latifolia TaxID=37657 RepID=UPI003D7827A6
MGQTISNDAEAENIGFKIREHAEAALEYFNSSQDDGKRYELVEDGLIMARGFTMDHLDRLEFKAKEKDCPTAPVEAFFAELSFFPHLRINSCVRLGTTQELPSVDISELLD